MSDKKGSKIVILIFIIDFSTKNEIYCTIIYSLIITKRILLSFNFWWSWGEYKKNQLDST